MQKQEKPVKFWLNSRTDLTTIGNVILIVTFAAIMLLFAYSALSGAQMIARPAF